MLDQPQPRRAEGRAGGQLVPALAGPRRHEIRDIGARDEEDEHYRGHEQRQRRPEISDEMIAQAAHAGVPAALGAVILRMFALQLESQPMEIGSGLLESDAGLHAGDHLPTVVAPGSRRPRVDRQRDPELGIRAGEAQVRRHHADDFARAPVEREACAHDIGIRAEPPRPQAEAQHDDSWRARPVLGGGEHPPERRSYTDDVEE